MPETIMFDFDLMQVTVWCSRPDGLIDVEYFTVKLTGEEIAGLDWGVLL